MTDDMADPIIVDGDSLETVKEQLQDALLQLPDKGDIDSDLDTEEQPRYDSIVRIA